MKRTNLDSAPWETWSSPGGKFHGESQCLSLVLGARENASIGEGGHPFDLEHGRLRPGKSGCPFHSHAAQWELFVIRRGRGLVRYGAHQREIGPGEAVMHPPGEAHQLTNVGDTPLEYFLIADNPAVDVWEYPDSAKWGFRPRGGFFRRTDVDYYDGEEDGAAQRPPRAPVPPPPGPLARFVAIDSIPEVELRSPKGTYHSYVRDISCALAGVPDTGTWAGGQPFDLQQRRVPPGAKVGPYHVHTLQWELYVVLAGNATVRSAGASHPVTAGDVFLQPPGTAHQIHNTGTADLVFYVIADNPPADSTFYPDSRKWMLAPQGRIFRMVETDYFDAEE